MNMPVLHKVSGLTEQVKQSIWAEGALSRYSIICINNSRQCMQSKPGRTFGSTYQIRTVYWKSSRSPSRGTKA